LKDFFTFFVMVGGCAGWMEVARGASVAHLCSGSAARWPRAALADDRSSSPDQLDLTAPLRPRELEL
jgi:hypothetical protein